MLAEIIEVNWSFLFLSECFHRHRGQGHGVHHLRRRRRGSLPGGAGGTAAEKGTSAHTSRPPPGGEILPLTLLCVPPSRSFSLQKNPPPDRRLTSPWSTEGAELAEPIPTQRVERVEGGGGFVVTCHSRILSIPNYSPLTSANVMLLLYG